MPLLCCQEEDKPEKTEQEKAQEKSRPVSSTPVSGTPWCVVWTGDGRVFFYNPSTRTSLWERPDELMGRADVDKLTEGPPGEKGRLSESLLELFLRTNVEEEKSHLLCEE